MLGKYTLKTDGRVRVGVTVFGYRAGKTIDVTQQDCCRDKVLVNFGGGYIDWFSKRWLDNNAEGPLQDESGKEQSE